MHKKTTLTLTLTLTLAAILLLSPIFAIAAYASTPTLIEANGYERIRLWQEDIDTLIAGVTQRHGKFWDESEIFIPYDLLGTETGQVAMWHNLERNEAIRQNVLNVRNTIHQP